MASFLNSDNEEFTFDLLNQNQTNNNCVDIQFENQTQTTSSNYYDATIKTVCYFFYPCSEHQIF